MQMPKSEMQMMQEINQLSFALDEVTLFLDTHPRDLNALEFYHQVLERKRAVVAEYTVLYGPLNSQSVTSKNEWSWVNGPWPWEGVGSSCGITRRDYNTR